MWIAVTGHRPDKLGGYNNDNAHRAIRRHMRDSLQEGPMDEMVLVSGGALGIDQFWMEVGLHLGIPVVAALPFEGYDSKWPAASRRKYAKLLDQCWDVRYICDSGYHPSKLQIRNEWMVDNSDALWAYWNGTEGGTANCVSYAIKRKQNLSCFNTDDIIANYR